MAGNSTKAVVAAISANGVVCVGKFVAFSFSGSGAMLSEGIHSAADTMNQALLLFGLRRSERGPDAMYPDGYGRARFFWGLVSALGIFFLGAGVTLYHGVHALMHPEPSSHGWITWVVLAGSIVLEGGAFAVAWRGLVADAKAVGMGPIAYAREGRDPTAAAIILEDGAAILGLFLAIAGIALEQVTGSPLWDALATLIIGFLLAGVALFLIKINRVYLLTRAVEPEVSEEVRRTLEADPMVERVEDLNGVIVTLGRYKIRADVDFRGESIADVVLDRQGLESWSTPMSDEEVRARLGTFAEEVVTELGRQVERLDATVRSQVPGVARLDLEAGGDDDEAASPPAAGTDAADSKEDPG